MNKLFILSFLFLSVTNYAQNIDSSLEKNTNKKLFIKEKDISEVFLSKINFSNKLFKKGDTIPHKYHVSVLPAFGYTLQTGFAGIISGNVGFKLNQQDEAKMSTISASITYSEFDQIIAPFYASIWSKNDVYNFISDNRYISYPSNIFGLGGTTDPNKGHTINFNQVKFHQTLLRKISKDIYLGAGFFYDNFYNVKVLDPQTRRINVYIQKEIGNTEVESGPVLKLLYDSRINQINPKQGNFLNLTIRQNFEELGSTREWASLLVDMRKYIPFPKSSKNILAFWSYNWLTIAGNPNYLLLPSTGWDDQYNTGRGYIQSRFRGKQMIYFESEYRYNITRDGLLGGVVFANIQNFNGNIRKYDNIIPAFGLGVRIKLNKYSGANLCLDYGFGNGSQGFFVNLGEVF